MRSIINEIRTQPKYYLCIMLCCLLISVFLFVGLISYDSYFIVCIINGQFWTASWLAASIMSIVILWQHRNLKGAIPLFLCLATPVIFLLIAEKKFSCIAISGLLILSAWFFIVCLIQPKKFVLPVFLLLSLSFTSSTIGGHVMSLKMGRQLEKAKVAAQPIIDKLEQYYQINGRYPDEIEGLGINQQMMELDYPFTRLYYNGLDNDYYLEFMHPLALTAYWYYTPETKEWKLD